MRKAKPDKRLTALIKAKMFERGIKRDEMAIYLNISKSTYTRRMYHHPEEFTLGDMKVFREKLKLDRDTLAEVAL